MDCEELLADVIQLFLLNLLLLVQPMRGEGFQCGVLKPICGAIKKSGKGFKPSTNVKDKWMFNE